MDGGDAFDELRSLFDGQFSRGREGIGRHTRRSRRIEIAKLSQETERGGRGDGGTATLSFNGKEPAEGRIAYTSAFVFSPDEGADVGVDRDTPVTAKSQAGPSGRFPGKIDKATVLVL
jgi:hypothetical protein